LNVRYALKIAMLLGSTLLAQGEPLNREKWVVQTGLANTSCLAKFRHKFGGAKDPHLRYLHGGSNEQRNRDLYWQQ
jgi:hypothetical protein